jgi:hypothetical protein
MTKNMASGLKSLLYNSSKSLVMSKNIHKETPVKEQKNALKPFQQKEERKNLFNSSFSAQYDSIKLCDNKLECLSVKNFCCRGYSFVEQSFEKFLGRDDTQQNDIPHNDIQHINTQHMCTQLMNTQHLNAQHMNTQRIKLSI